MTLCMRYMELGGFVHEYMDHSGFVHEVHDSGFVYEVLGACMVASYMSYMELGGFVHELHGLWWLCA